MLALQVMYTLSAIVALAAGLPQMYKLIKTKNSDEFSLNTWVVWACTQMVSAIYLATLGDVLVVAICATWIAFYLAMVVLIVKYTPPKQVPVTVTE